MVHVQTKFRQAKCCGSRVIVFTDFLMQSKNNTAVTSAGSGRSRLPASLDRSTVMVRITQQAMASRDEWRVVCAGIDVDSTAATVQRTANSKKRIHICTIR